MLDDTPTTSRRALLAGTGQATLSAVAIALLGGSATAILLAAHYVLGLLDPADMARIEARASHDRAFAALLGRQDDPPR